MQPSDNPDGMFVWISIELNKEEKYRAKGYQLLSAAELVNDVDNITSLAMD